MLPLLVFVVLTGWAGLPRPAAGQAWAPVFERASLRASLAQAPLPGTTGQPASKVGVSKVRAAPTRSVGLAFGLSAVVPGLGQAYNRNWVKAAIAIALESAVIGSSIAWRNQGLGLEDEYKQYAHAYWSPAKYATWLNDYSQYLQLNFGATVTAPAVRVPSGLDFTTPEAWNDLEWQQARAFFTEIQSLERQMFHVETLAAFSHTLPHFTEQQYYELVGKYYQFAPGWSDYPAWIEDGEYRTPIDPSMTGPDESRPNVSPRFFTYADDHAHANDVLRRASRVSMLLVVTHLASAVEAAVSAKLHNDRLTPGIDLGVGPEGDVRTVASLSLRF